MIYVATLSVNSSDEVHPSSRAQIIYLKVDEVFTKVLSEYANFAHVFSPKLAAELLEYTRTNDYAIKWVDNCQPPYGLIYNLSPIELEILKVYIENIKPFKFPARALIFFDEKANGSLRLCVDYWSLNSLTIKNWYFLPLVRELLDQQDRARHFT